MVPGWPRFHGQSRCRRGVGQLSNSQCFSGPGAWEAAASWGLILGRGAAGFKDAVLCQLPPGPKKGGWPFCAAASDSQGSLVRWAEASLSGLASLGSSTFGEEHFLRLGRVPPPPRPPSFQHLHSWDSCSYPSRVLVNFSRKFMLFILVSLVTTGKQTIKGVMRFYLDLTQPAVRNTLTASLSGRLLLRGLFARANCLPFRILGWQPRIAAGLTLPTCRAEGEEWEG